MWAYFGTEIFLPDWVACEVIYCIAGQSRRVHLYRQAPIERLTTITDNGSDPREQLVRLGLSSEQARALIDR